MQKINPIYLTEADVRKMLPNEIGHGTDGMVFKYDKEYLIKIYHNRLKFIDNKITDDSDIKIYNGDISRNRFCEPITYIDEEDVKLRSNYAIDTIINRQKQVKRTHLPKAPVYINERFAGYLIKKLNGIQIHKLSGMPLKYKKIILKEVIESVEELLENHIYHVDLANSPNAQSLRLNNRGEIENVGHSHVLVNPFNLKTHIIDLDGKSTIYTERKREDYERKSMYGLCILILEFLLNIDFKEYEENIDGIFNLLAEKEIYNKFIEPLGYCELNIEQSKDFVKSIGKV